MVQAFAQRDAYAWIQNSMHTLEVMHKSLCVLIFSPAVESDLIPVPTSPRLTSLMLSITTKFAPILQTDSWFNPIWMLTYLMRTAEPFRPDTLRFLAEQCRASTFKIKYDLYHCQYHIASRRWHDFHLCLSRSRRRRRRHSHIVLAEFDISFTAL